MVALITDRRLERSLIRHRRARGIDHHDEVWDGTYVIYAPPDNEHQSLVGRLTSTLQYLIVDPQLGLVLPGCNVSDRATKWKENYRCPDVTVFLNGTRAINKRTHWLGGPDLAFEIVSPHDRSREKLDFYAAVGTRELIVVDRHPWALELYRLTNGELVLSGRSTVDDGVRFETEFAPLVWRLVEGDERPLIEVTQRGGSQKWLA